MEKTAINKLWFLRFNAKKPGIPKSNELSIAEARVIIQRACQEDGFLIANLNITIDHISLKGKVFIRGDKVIFNYDIISSLQRLIFTKLVTGNLDAIKYKIKTLLR